MWQSVGACGRESGLVHGRRHAAGVGTCGRVWRHVAGCGDMWHGWWQDVGHVAGVWICNKGSGLVHGWRDVAGVGTCGRVWGHAIYPRALPHTPTLGPDPPHVPKPKVKKLLEELHERLCSSPQVLVQLSTSARGELHNQFAQPVCT